MVVWHDIAKPRTGWGGLFGLLRAAWAEYERDHARYFAVAMVYYAFVSLVPLILLLLAMIGLLLRFSHLAGVAEQQLLRTIEASMGSELRTTVEHLFNQLQQESVLATFVSLAGLLLTASGLFRQLRLSFRALWRYTPPLVSGSLRVIMRTTMVEQAKAFLMVVIGGVLLLAALTFIAGVQWLSGLFGNLPFINERAYWLLALPSPIGVAAITFAFLFAFLPPVRLHLRHIWLATALCTAAWVIGAEILAIAGAIFGSQPSASGAIGGLLVMMLWMSVVSQLLFYGAELCKVIAWREGLGVPRAAGTGT